MRFSVVSVPGWRTATVPVGLINSVVASADTWYIRAVPPLVSPEKAPNFGLSVLGDLARTLELAGFRGHPVVVNFWASSCVDCRAELFALARAAEQAPDVRFVGLDVADSSPVAALTLADQAGIAHPTLRSVARRSPRWQWPGVRRRGAPGSREGVHRHLGQPAGVGVDIHRGLAERRRAFERHDGPTNWMMAPWVTVRVASSVPTYTP
jgi:thiol-disulfide isomerase/thioredoxin